MLALVLSLLVAAPAFAFDSAREDRNNSKTHEREAEYSGSDYQTKLAQRSAEGTSDGLQTLANDPTRDFLGNLCWRHSTACAGDIRLWDWEKNHHGIVREVLFTARDGATLSGHVWATRSGPAKRPAIEITEGSIQADEQYYWWAATSLAKEGYVVLTWDAQGQGRSDIHGEPGSDYNEGVPAQTDGRPFYDGTEDAINFMLSNKAHPYKPVPSCTSGTSHAGKQNSRVQQGLNPAYNPLWRMIDPSRVGIAGHSYGAAGVSYIGQWDPRVDAVVAWDNLGPPDPAAGLGEEPCPANPAARRVVPRTKPALGMSSDYGLTSQKYSSDPDPKAKSTESLQYSKRGVPTGQVIIRGGTHYDYSWIPDPAFGATLRGVDFAAWYTAAWFDKFVKRDHTADDRLLTNRWQKDRPEARVDPDHDGNIFSFYYRSRLDFPRASTAAASRRFTSENLRRSRALRSDCDPVPYSFLKLALSADRPHRHPVCIAGSGTRCVARRTTISSRRIGSARLGRSFRRFFHRYRALRHYRRAHAYSFCVRGRRGRFLVGARKGKIDFLATTVRRHHTRRHHPGQRLRASHIRGARRVARGVQVGHRFGRGRVVYGVRGRKVRFLAVVTRRQTVHRRALVRRLRAAKLVPKRRHRR
ncbi:MAG: hypothetical protein ABR581_03145 [Thermoleophilaceae bacterium]